MCLTQILCLSFWNRVINPLQTTSPSGYPPTCSNFVLDLINLFLFFIFSCDVMKNSAECQLCYEKTRHSAEKHRLAYLPMIANNHVNNLGVVPRTVGATRQLHWPIGWVVRTESSMITNKTRLVKTLACMDVNIRKVERYLTTQLCLHGMESKSFLIGYPIWKQKVDFAVH